MVPSLSRRVIAVVQATALSSAIAAAATFSWNGLLIANLSTPPAVPWSVPTMAVVLYLLWRYLAGAWWPRRTAGARRALLRAAPIDRMAFAWSVIAGALGVVALVGLWIALVEITGSGGNPTLPDVSAYPPLTIAVVVTIVFFALFAMAVRQVVLSSPRHSSGGAALRGEAAGVVKTTRQ